MIIKKTLIKYILFFLSGIFSICSAQQQEPQELRGRVIHVHDGDTYTILVEGNKQVKVRMQGIDAPESGQDFSKKAKEYLRTLIIQKNVVVKYIEKDQYERILGETLLPDGKEAGKEMLKAGYAWHLKLYNSNEELAKLEKEAQVAKKGMWIDPHPVEPWIERNLRRKGYKSVEIKRMKIDGKIETLEAAKLIERKAKESVF